MSEETQTRKHVSFVLHVPLYGVQCLVSLGQTDEELQERLDAHKEDLNGTLKVKKFSLKKTKKRSAADGVLVRSKKRGPVLRMANFPETPYDFGVLQHEIFHLVFHILDKLGFELTHSSEEAFAYLQGYITEQIYLVINDQPSDCTDF